MSEMIELPIKLYVIIVILLICNSISFLLHKEKDFGDFFDCLLNGIAAIWILQYANFLIKVVIKE